MTDAKRSLPVSWSNGQQRVPGRSLVATPSAEDLKLYGDQRRLTCGSCRHFRHEAGQAAMEKERFVERLVIEEQWKVRHLGCSPKDYGFCQQHGKSTITSLHAQACDQHTPKRGVIGLHLPEEK